MRDEFLKLLVPTIYTDYFSHKSVFKYENIKGLTSSLYTPEIILSYAGDIFLASTVFFTVSSGLSRNLFFVTHENSEKCERESSSKSNPFEADFVTRLALYLRMQGYDSTQIVILTTYSGQVRVFSYTQVR